MSYTHIEEPCAKCGKINLINIGDTSDMTGPDTESFRCYACKTVCKLPEFDGEDSTIAEEQDYASEDGIPLPSNLESSLHQARNRGGSRGGMGDVQIIFNPYKSLWRCQFNWSSNQPISAEGQTMEVAIANAIAEVEKQLKPT